MRVRTVLSKLALLPLLLLGTGAAGAADTKLHVVAALPNLGSIAAEIGGDRIEVTTIASGLQDAHFVDPKPSFIVKLRGADLILVNGLDLEIGWIPPLVQGARNAHLLPGGDGYIDCSSRVGVLEIPTGAVSRAAGDVHPYGNPHYLTDPLNAEPIATCIAEALGRKAPASASYFEERRAGFVRRLQAAMFGKDLVELVGGSKLARLAQSGELKSFLDSSESGGRPLAERLGGWMGAMRPYEGAKIVTYHKDFSYFARRFGLDVVEYVEPKPGIPPSAKHLAELTQMLQGGQVKLLLTRPYVEHRSTSLLADSTKIQVLTLPMEVGGAPEATDYVALFDYLVSSISTALRGAPAGAGR
ncbi:MAG TPA: metal ABC transporter substrate-binding protein [Candidatus Polarisedimenticolia bacterium]|nr:metal ABC transporter substrate-binding protein [Candidatus Polarisedimenticolia bacterium]